MENHPRYMEVIWGCHYAGLIYTACSSRLTSGELVHLINDCGARVFITSAYKADQAEEIVADTPAVEVRLMLDSTTTHYGSYEDAVATAEKPAARKLIAGIVGVPRPRATWVRVNATSTPFCYEDLLSVCIAGVAGIILPKVESAEEIRMVDWILSQLERQRGLPARDILILGIIETARGVRDVNAIAGASPRLRRLMFGAIDFAAEVSIDLGDDVGGTNQARFAIACASRAAGLEPPMDTAYIDIHNLDGLRATTTRARGLGYRGKACIHPAQVEVVNAIFTPTEEQITRAKRIVDGFDEAESKGLGAIMLDGQMLDYPVVELARRVLVQAKAAGVI